MRSNKHHNRDWREDPDGRFGRERRDLSQRAEAMKRVAGNLWGMGKTAIIGREMKYYISINSTDALLPPLPLPSILIVLEQIPIAFNCRMKFLYSMSIITTSLISHRFETPLFINITILSRHPSYNINFISYSFT
jgi:hypothetical protein